MTLETKMKISASKKGTTPWNKGMKYDAKRYQSQFSEAYKKRMSEVKKGYVFSETHKNNISKAKTGIKRGPLNEEWRRKIAQANSGEKCWRWKGGLTDINAKIRNTLDARLWREKVFQRDNYTCQMCAVRGGRLEADHIKPFSQYPELRLELSNGRTLCKECHKKTDTYLYKATAGYIRNNYQPATITN